MHNGARYPAPHSGERPRGPSSPLVLIALQCDARTIALTVVVVAKAIG